MNLLEHFDEEYSKVLKSHGSINAAILQATDVAKSLSISYKKLIDIKPDVQIFSEIDSKKIEDILFSMEKFIKDCKVFVNDINIALKSTNNIKES